MQEVVRILETHYGHEHLHEILDYLETKGVESSYYKESKIDRDERAGAQKGKQVMFDVLTLSLVLLLVHFVTKKGGK